MGSAHTAGDTQSARHAVGLGSQHAVDAIPDGRGEERRGAAATRPPLALQTRAGHGGQHARDVGGVLADGPPRAARRVEEFSLGA